MTDSPFFLVGCPRSGTTLLQVRLDAHPDVAVAPETFYVRDFVGKPKRYERADSVAGRERLVKDLVERPEFIAMGVDPEEYSRAVAAAAPGWRAPFAILLEQFARARGAARVGEKTPNHLLEMRTLEEWFPDAAFVHVVRDPRAVAASWRDVPWSNGSLAADAAVWRKYMIAARERPPKSGRVLTVRFESLVSAPSEELARVFAFLDLAPAPESIDVTPAATAVDVEREPWKKRALAPVSTEPADRWRRELTATDVRAVEAATWPELEQAGYRPTCSRLAILPGVVAGAGRRALKAWRGARRSRGS